jgi:hypothetical protein
MAEMDIGFKLAAHSSGREMCRLRRIIPQVWEPIVDTLQTTERLADRAFRAEENGERFAVYFEAYSSWRQEFRWNIQAKSALLAEREQTPTLTFLFFLRPDGYAPMDGTFQQLVLGRPTQQTWWEEICLWQEQPQPWWDHVPGLMALLPLCDHGRAEEDVVTYAAEHIVGTVSDTKVRSDLLTTLGIFGKMRYPALDAFALIGREHMRESPFYQEILTEGAMQAQRKAVLKVLAARFGEGAGEEFRDELETIMDESRLWELHGAATKCRTVGGFRRALHRPST